MTKNEIEDKFKKALKDKEKEMINDEIKFLKYAFKTFRYKEFEDTTKPDKNVFDKIKNRLEEQLSRLEEL